MWYLVFLGTITVPIQAESAKAARAVVAADYLDRGITIDKKEMRARRATYHDAGWLRDMGAEAVADAVAGVGVGK